jgi:hypothetical protein
VLLFAVQAVHLTALAVTVGTLAALDNAVAVALILLALRPAGINRKAPTGEQRRKGWQGLPDTDTDVILYDPRWAENEAREQVDQAKLLATMAQGKYARIRQAVDLLLALVGLVLLGASIGVLAALL